MSGVFANGLEISGKAVDAKTIAAFPDTCFTPPENPATPPGVPVPYPSFGMASDTENGTGTVFIGGKTVNLKNKSDVSKTSGTEAGCAAKKGVITSKNTGKKYFHSWSNDVKFDGEPVIRFSDLGTHNHASPGGNEPPWPEIAKQNTPGAIVANQDCLVGEYDKIVKACNAMGGEAHHVVPDMVYRVSTRSAVPRVSVGSVAGQEPPNLATGMAICMKPKNHDGLHSKLNRAIAKLGENSDPPGTAKIKELVSESAKSIAELEYDTPAERDCAKTAAKEAAKQAQPFNERTGRAMPYSTPKTDTDTYTVLGHVDK